MSKVKDLESAAEGLASAVGRLGLERAEVILSEGFCVSCMTHSAPGPVFDEEVPEPERLTPSAVVWCAKCGVHWRTGLNPNNSRPWVSHSIARNNMILTMAANAPSESIEEDENDWFFGGD